MISVWLERLFRGELVENRVLGYELKVMVYMKDLTKYLAKLDTNFATIVMDQLYHQ